MVVKDGDLPWYNVKKHFEQIQGMYSDMFVLYSCLFLVKWNSKISN